MFPCEKKIGDKPHAAVCVLPVALFVAGGNGIGSRLERNPTRVAGWLRMLIHTKICLGAF
jgi:hypothetical protein